MLFPAVLMNFPNSKVCLIGEWSIIKGEQSMAVKTKICEAMLQESFNPPSQTHSGISPGDHMDKIESLRSGQLLNGEGIQLLANSVSQIPSIIAELQAKAKPSTDDLSKKIRKNH